MHHTKNLSKPGRMMYIIENITASGNTTIRNEYFISLLNTKAFPGATSLRQNDRFKLEQVIDWTLRHDEITNE